MAAEPQPLETPTPKDVLAAADRVRPFVHRTALLTSHAIDEACGRRVVFKAEHLQKVGAYKARGATNQIRTLLENGAPPPGVVASSSGNHGQAVAWAAGLAGIPATVVVPDWIAAPKRAAMEGYGATVRIQPGAHDERNRVAAELAASEGFVDIPPYDHPVTIAGQGTWVLEAFEDGAAGIDTVVVPIGGGGLASGTILGLEAMGADAKVYGVEPAGADDTRRSIEAGHRVPVDHPDSIADALLANQPGRIPFEILREGLAGALTVTDDEIVAAMRMLWERAKQVVEPGGATAFAAVVAGRVPGDGPVLVMLSGGNVDLDRFSFSR
jgi:threo-3-hydroxy-L-aspartate ammonia-lyase